jgi:hypothetical protein
MIYSKVVTQHLPGGRRKSRKIWKDSKSPDQDLNQRLHKYKSVVLTSHAIQYKIKKLQVVTQALMQRRQYLLKQH